MQPSTANLTQRLKDAIDLPDFPSSFGKTMIELDADLHTQYATPTKRNQAYQEMRAKPKPLTPGRILRLRHFKQALNHEISLSLKTTCSPFNPNLVEQQQQRLSELFGMFCALFFDEEKKQCLTAADLDRYLPLSAGISSRGTKQHSPASTKRDDDTDLEQRIATLLRAQNASSPPRLSQHTHSAVDAELMALRTMRLIITTPLLDQPPITASKTLLVALRAIRAISAPGNNNTAATHTAAASPERSLIKAIDQYILPYQDPPRRSTKSDHKESSSPVSPEMQPSKLKAILRRIDAVKAWPPSTDYCALYRSRSELALTIHYTTSEAPTTHSQHRLQVTLQTIQCCFDELINELPLKLQVHAINISKELDSAGKQKHPLKVRSPTVIILRLLKIEAMLGEFEKTALGDRRSQQDTLDRTVPLKFYKAKQQLHRPIWSASQVYHHHQNKLECLRQQQHDTTQQQLQDALNKAQGAQYAQLFQLGCLVAAAGAAILFSWENDSIKDLRPLMLFPLFLLLQFVNKRILVYQEKARKPADNPSSHPKIKATPLQPN